MGPTAFSVSSERHRQSGVNEIAQASKRLVNRIPSTKSRLMTVTIDTCGMPVCCNKYCVGPVISQSIFFKNAQQQYRADVLALVCAESCACYVTKRGLMGIPGKWHFCQAIDVCALCVQC